MTETTNEKKPRKESKDLPAVVGERDKSVEGLISQAIAEKVPVETLDKLFTLRERVKAEQAKEAFIEALQNFQLQCPVIKKTKKVLNKDQRSVRYMFAPLDGIAEQIKKPLRDNKLSYSWNTEHTQDHMRVTCKVTHLLGHFDTSALEIPIDKEGFMTAPQKYASAQTFAKRYTLLNALGITTADEDTDAGDVGKEKDAKSVKTKIILRLRSLKEVVDSKTGDKAEEKRLIQEAVKRLTKLGLEPENYEEIVNRLDVIISERNEK